MDRNAARRDVLRGAAWLALGERRAALRAFQAANGELWGEPAALAALAFQASGLGLHGVASSAAAHVLDTAPPAARASAPAGLRRLSYPDAFGDLVRSEAEANGLPAALLFALVRQESRYEPSAVSSAGAAGLTQVMPATGRQIAAALGQTAFDADDLFQPQVSVRFGAWYLAEQRRDFGGSDWPALAAYNGGPGNARRWLEAAGGDLELFVELIDYQETRRYVRLVSEHRAQYEQIYGTAGH